MTAHP